MSKTPKLPVPDLPQQRESPADQRIRQAKAKAYAHWWSRQQAKQLHRDRAALVRRYRLSDRHAFPDGIHGKDDPWYNPDDWDVRGRWKAPHEPPWLTALGLTRADLAEKPVTSFNTPAAIQDQLTNLLRSRATLAAQIAQEEVSINKATPSKVDPPPVTKTVTAVTPTVTKSVTPVTPVTENVTQRNALSNAERQRLYRQRKAKPKPKPD